MKKSETAQILMYIMSDFDAAPTQEKIEVWHDQIKHLDPEFAMGAARALMREEHFGIPRVADFLRIVEHMSKTPAERMTTGEAWEKLLGAVRTYGVDQASRAALSLREFPRIIAAARQVGWRRICLADEKEMPFVEKKFGEYFEALKERDDLDRQVMPMSGELRTLVDGVTKALPGAKDDQAKH